MTGTEPLEATASERFEAIVIGTGFGGAVVAARLAQAGYDFCVLERGRRYESRVRFEDAEPESDLPKLPTADRIFPDFARWSWAADGGLWDVRDLGGAHVVQAAAYGGGSIIYANVHLRPPPDAFEGWPEPYRLLGDRAGDVAGESESLDRYYDLAASMLDVKPITEAPFAGSLVKTEQMLKVARSLGRSEDFFYPPLAVNFEDKTNAFGVRQRACKACGECNTGCRHGAKNTLDLNYLKIAERSDRAHIRTEAEAEVINHFEGREYPYEVRYRDHLRGGEVVRIRAKYVFVCAGAVNSTTLLLRSRDAACIASNPGESTDPGLTALTSRDGLGNGYFANADALGMVYDASLSAEHDEKSNGSLRHTPRDLAPSFGPVITTAITYRDEHDPNLFFLLQEGGFPESLARHVGLMRAPIYLRRNRYERADSEIDVIDGSEPPAERRSQGGPARRVVEPRGGLLSLADGALRLVEAGDLDRMVPLQLRSSLERLSKELAPFRRRELELIVSETMKQLIERDARFWTHVFTLGIVKEPSERVRRVVRWLYGHVAPIGEVTDYTDLAVRKRYAPTAANLRRAAGYLASFTDDHRIHSRQSLVLLAMGRDETPGTITLGRDAEPIIRLKEKADAKLHGLGELMMRDVAAAVRGKLRVNPLWAFGRKPISVHSQGGCPMASDGSHGVVDPNGEVYGCRGLYVMDAAIFPRPVGVNPSASIAAIAERNIRRFIVAHPPGAQASAAPGSKKTSDYDGASWDRENWMRAEFWRESSKAWLARPPANGSTGKAPPRPRLSPPDHRSRPAISKPIGITFFERLSGFHGESLGDDRSGREEEPYEFAAKNGRQARPHQTLSLLLKASVPDLAVFMRDPKRTVLVCGVARARWPAADVEGRFLVSGEIHLLPQARSPSERQMTYALTLEQRRRRFRMDGIKWLRNDPGPDAWHDATTLYVDLTSDNARSKGTLHVAMNHFLFRQVRSLRVQGTDDPARIVWAVSAFATYFFGALQRVYVPELQKIVDLVDHIELR